MPLVASTSEGTVTGGDTELSLASVAYCKMGKRKYFSF